MKYYRLNNRIRAPQVRLIDENGQFVNIINTDEAIKIAQERGLDLVEINPMANPPVAKIMNFDQFRYEEAKKDKGQKIKKVELKTIRLSLRTGKHDLEIKVNQAKKFIHENNKVRFELFLRGRERAHQDLAHKTLGNIIQLLAEVANVEQPIGRQGAKLSVVVAKK